MGQYKIVCTICGTEFESKHKYSKYCCADCRKKAKYRMSNEHHKSYREQYKGVYKKKQPVKVMSWAEVAAICNEHNLSYGKAKALGLIV